jgi:23S rRNA (uracil1939-C5)-methyltransferase
MMKRGDEIVLLVGGLSGNGTTVTRVDGFVVFVKGAVPGDTARVRVQKVKKSFAEAFTLEILTPSPGRVKPRCGHFGTCGGCRWQDLAYESQLECKRERVAEAFKHIGGFASVEVDPVVPCTEPYNYRNKMEFTFSNHRWLTDAELQRDEVVRRELALGLHVPERYDKVLDINECFLQSEMSTSILKTVRRLSRVWNLNAYSTRNHEGYLRHLVIREGKRTGDVMVNLVTTYDRPDVLSKLTTALLEEYPTITTVVNNITERKSMVAIGDRERVYHGPGFISELLGRFIFRISANSFFQTNTLQAERLYDVTRELASLKSSDVVYDLYSGTGTIALYLSDAVDRVVAIESVPEAIVDAQRNAEANGVPNCFFLQGDLKDRLTKRNEWLGDHPQPTVIIVDPPRSGLHPKVIERVAKFSADRIVYVSCNPATQARDAHLLSGSQYRLRIVRPVDMFPHTDHIEAVALFERVG